MKKHGKSLRIDLESAENPRNPMLFLGPALVTSLAGISEVAV